MLCFLCYFGLSLLESIENVMSQFILKGGVILQSGLLLGDIHNILDVELFQVFANSQILFFTVLVSNNALFLVSSGETQESSTAFIQCLIVSVVKVLVLLNVCLKRIVKVNLD